VQAAGLEYGEIFERRGRLYDDAMSAFPDARREELEQAVAWADVRAGHIVADLPSGPGYLGPYLPANARVVHVETSRFFAARCRAKRGDAAVVLGTFEALPLRRESVDRVISLAALHHVADVAAFLVEAYRVLRPGGALCIADACRGSAVAEFLNGFVDAHNSMGHRGTFLAPPSIADVETVGFRVEQSAMVSCPWWFASTRDMTTFVRRIFGLDRATPDETLEGIRRHLGYATGADGCRMSWELLFVRARRR